MPPNPYISNNDSTVAQSIMESWAAYKYNYLLNNLVLRVYNLNDTCY